MGVRIYKGDDTDFAGLSTISIVIKTDLSLTGFTGSFRFFNATRTFTSEQIATKTVTVAYTSAETALFPVGVNCGTFTLTDTSNRKAVIQKVPIEVVLHPVRPDETQTIVVEIDSAYNYDKLCGLPTINGFTVTGDKNGHDYGLANYSDVSTPGQVEAEKQERIAADTALSNRITPIETIVSGVKEIDALDADATSREIVAKVNAIINEFRGNS